MSDASLLKLELYRQIEKQRLQEIIQSKLLSCYTGCVALMVAGGLISLIPWFAATLGVIAFIGLFMWGKRSLKKIREEIEINEQALKDVYFSTDGSKLSTEDIRSH